MVKYLHVFQVWDEELATVAQKHADQCIFQHDCPECRSVGKKISHKTF